MVKGHGSLSRDERAPVAPTLRDGNGIVWRGQFDIDGERVFQDSDGTQDRVLLGDDLDVDVYRCLAPAKKHGRCAAREKNARGAVASRPMACIRRWMRSVSASAHASAR